MLEGITLWALPPHDDIAVLVALLLQVGGRMAGLRGSIIAQHADLLVWQIDNLSSLNLSSNRRPDGAVLAEGLHGLKASTLHKTSRRRLIWDIIVFLASSSLAH